MIRKPIFLPKALDRWIDHPEETPDISYLMSSPFSHPLIYLVQISNYISIIQEGMDQEKLLRNTHSATGFSTGIMAAVMLSMGLPLDELWQLAIKTQVLFFWQGIRTQQSILNYGVRPQLVAELYNSNEGSPSCMASVDGLTRAGLEAFIHAFYGYGTVYLAYELNTERLIVSGIPEDLIRFNKFLKERVKEVRWRYIASTIAAHSPYLSYALDTSPLDAQQLGLIFKGADMKIPVLSNDMGKDLRASENVILDVMRAYFLCPAVWRSQIAPLFQPNNHITYVLDFGPGTGVASLTESHISGSDIQIIRCALPLGRKMLFEEVLPALG
jgi:malonyl CoA-acyl carrier protein transacylase